MELLNNYEVFVTGITSKESNSLTELINRVDELDIDSHVNISLLMSAGFGLGTTVGEFQGTVNNVLFHEKELSNANILHMKCTLGNVIRHWSNACRALNLNPNDVIWENVKQLESEYPEEQFDLFHYHESDS